MDNQNNIDLNKEIIKVEEQKKVLYSYKKVKLQHLLIDGKTVKICISTSSNNLSNGNAEIKYSEDEARALLNILQTMFNETEEDNRNEGD